MRRCADPHLTASRSGADEHYCSDMAKPGTWGDNVTLQVWVEGMARGHGNHA